MFRHLKVLFLGFLGFLAPANFMLPLRHAQQLDWSMPAGPRLSGALIGTQARSGNWPERHIGPVALIGASPSILALIQNLPFVKHIAFAAACHFALNAPLFGHPALLDNSITRPARH
jgi:hypothetical protein